MNHTLSRRMLLADQSRFAAVTARRGDGSRTTMRRAASARPARRASAVAVQQQRLR